ncbi:MAG: YfhO family protein [Ignavibacteriae bacterium]|nr:YfhO family protein [Ignavibacteriota bacterium]
MAKSKSTQVKQQTKKVQTNNQGINLDAFSSDTLKARYIFLGIIVLAILIFFSKGVFEGKIFASADNLSPLSFKTFLDDAKAQGIFPLWVPYIFMGMPSLASLTAAIPSVHNVFSYIWDSVLAGISGGNLFVLTLPYYFLFAISLFFYARYKFKNNLIALYCALMGVFATGIIQLIIVGHHTKMMTFSFFPIIMLFLDKLIDSEDENRYKMMLNFGLLAMLVFLQLHFHHMQMLFYSYMMIGIYILYRVIFSLVKKIEIKKIIRAFVLLIVAVFFAVSMDADIILSVKEYNKYSMRGESSIVSKSDPQKKDDKPLSYDYATNWSFSPGEMLTFIVPHYYGFGSVEVNGQRTNLYWGQMPFTDSPVYFGVITLLLAVIGVTLNFRKNNFVQALTVIIIFFMLLSFGRTLPIIYNLFYNYVPLFGSFRAPVMIHYYIDLAFVVLAGFGLKSIWENFKDDASREKLKKLSLILGSIAGLMLLISFFGFENSYTNSVANSPLIDKLKSQGANAQQISQYVKQVSTIAYKNAVSDLMLHSFLLLIVISMMYLLSIRKVTLSLFMVVVLVIALFDLLNISTKTLHWDEKAQKEDFIAETDYSKWILNKDPDTYQYRVAEFSKGSLITSNNLAYYRFHSFNGYQGAKIRIYQDAVDVAGGENPFLLGLANVKYIISDAPIKDTLSYSEVYKGKSIIYKNKFAMPRAFFVSEYKIETGLNILQNIREAKFNPYTTAFLEKDINQKIDKPDSTVSAKITRFNIHNIEYEVNASGNNLLVLSEVYYPLGWKAYIDGQETEFFKTNYLLRSIVVPAGKHKVEFVFHPDTYYLGKSISIGANLVLIFILFAGAVGVYRQRKNILVKENK